MKVGVISDIHGNLPALQAVLTELGQEGVERIICCGDMVGTLGWSDAVCSLVRLTADTVVYGNHDANVMSRFQNSNQVLSMEYRIVMDDLSSENLAWLSELPDKREFMLGGYHTTLVHAHPYDEPHHGFPAENYVNPRNYTHIGSNMETSVLFHGHTHEQHAVNLSKFDGLRGTIVNPGSVGVPWYEPAEYAIYDPNGQDVDLRTAEYDTERNIERFKELGLDGWREDTSRNF